MKQFQIEPGSRVDLKDHDSRDKSAFPMEKEEGKAAMHEMHEKLYRLQTLLYAEHKRKILVVIQAMDTGGKDGTVRHVFRHMDPAGIRVHSFKKPSEEELDHDYLWRIHQHTPPKGCVAIFNRSHYEDIIAVRVKKIAPERVWSKRYDHVVNFEKMLTDEGTIVVKFFLNISKEEQKERLQARLDEPHKTWKFNPDDLKDRARWDEFQSAYEDLLSKTSTKHAPWHIIPADRKWQRNLIVAQTMIDVMEGLDMKNPEVDFDPSSIVIED